MNSLFTMRLLQVIAFLVVPQLVTGQKISPAQEAIQLRKLLQNSHMLAQPVNDDLASKVFAVLLDHADPDRFYFLASEITKLRQSAFAIDDDLNKGAWTFFPVFLDHYKNALVRAGSIAEKHSQRPLDLNKSERQKIDTTWAIDEKSLDQRWRIFFESEALHDLARVQAKFPDGKSIGVLETSSRERVRLQIKRSINRILHHAEGVDNYLKGMFFKSVTNAFDPHSEYMSSEQVTTFLSGADSEGYFFGFTMAENEYDEMSVSHVIPGEPAWTAGMQVGDVIERLRWEGKEWIEMNGVSHSEMDITFAESNTATMNLVLRKADGTAREISLKKQKRNNERSLARSFLMKGEKTVGYITLPSFYSDFGGIGHASAANDVAKEIIKLKNHDVDGIILDLRYNGGGSLRESVDMAGIFIDVGPVGIEANRDEEPETIKDFNRGTIYDGPLVVMVNSASASASEFLGAALQDYRRAVIVGSTTFGKAIAQEMFPLSPAMPEMNYSDRSRDDGWGYATVTISKIYRINGRSIQRTGLVPDIEIPDYLSAFFTREKDMLFAIGPDSIRKKTFYTPFKPLPISALKSKSEGRLRADARFQAIREYAEYLEKEGSNVTEELEWTKVKSKVENEVRMLKGVSIAAMPSTTAFTIELHEFGRVHKDQNKHVDLINEQWITALSKDVTLEESYMIMCDFIELQK
jgi:carboxyl-terminal processing protease